MNRKQLEAELKAVGLAVKDGKVKKSDIVAILTKVKAAMEGASVEDLVKTLPDAWAEYMTTNDWGSGEDAIHVTDEIEQEWYVEQCYEAGLSDDEVKQVLNDLGFTSYKPHYHFGA